MTLLQENILRLTTACANPRSQLDYYLSQGKKVIGCFPAFTPEELVHASGMVPMGLWGGRIEPKLAKSYLPAFACPIMQADMEFGLNGTYNGLSAVIIPTLCDTLRCMTQNWRFGVKEIPMIPMVYPQNRKNSANIDYLISEFEIALAMLASITGQMLNEKALCDSIAVYNKHNSTMKEFTTVANDHLDIITPRVRHHIMKSAFFFEKAEHTEIVEKIIEELNKLPIHNYSGKKVILTGITCEPDALLDILAKNNIAVVGDDLVQESQQFRTNAPLTGGGALKRVALQWAARYGCSLIHEDGKPRGTLLQKLYQANKASGVINCMMKFCDPEEYDQPYLETNLRNANIPVISIAIDQQDASVEQLNTRIQAFCELL